MKGNNKSPDPRKNIPQFVITFPDGENTTTNFSFFEAFPNLTNSKSCQYLGNLNNHPENSIIAASGCLHLESENRNSSDGTGDEEKMYFTMFSDKVPNKRFFSLDQNGNVEDVLSDGLDDATMEFEKEYLDPSNFNSSSIKLDGLDDDKDYQEGGNEVSGKEIRLNIAFGVDKSVQEVLGPEESIQNWIGGVMAHMQAFYVHPSLKTKIILEVIYNDIF